MPTPRINDIVLKRRGISADTAMRRARYFGGDAQSWLNLQTIYDLRVAERTNARKLDAIAKPGSVPGPILALNSGAEICCMKVYFTCELTRKLLIYSLY